MAITIVVTAGAANANSYVSIAEVDAHAETTAFFDTWDALATDDDKKPFLVQATRWMDTIRYRGRPASDTQALQHPRWDMYAPSGSMWPSDAIVNALKVATCHLAVWLATKTGDPFAAPETANVKRKKLIDVVGETEYFAPPNSEGDNFLAHTIMPMLAPWGLLGSSGVRLTR